EQVFAEQYSQGAGTVLDLPGTRPPQSLLRGHGANFYVLGHFRLSLSGEFDAQGQVDVIFLVALPDGGVEAVDVPYLLAACAYLLAQFLADHLFHGGISPVVQAACGHFQAPFIYRLAVLPYQHYVAVSGHRYHADRAWAVL